MLDVEPKPRAGRGLRRPALPVGRRVVVGALLAALVVGAVFVVNLSHSEPRLASVDRTRLDAFSTALEPGATVCQRGEVVPPDAGAVGLAVGLFGGSSQPLAISVTDGDGVRRSQVTSAYSDGERVVAPLSGPQRASGDARLCVRNDGDARIALGGIGDAAQIVGDSAIVEGRVAVSWYRPGSESWWSVASTVAQRAGRSKAGWIGAWTLWVALAAVLATAVLAVAMVAGARRRPVRVAIACGLVALVNAAAWAILVPPFQAPDEYKHVAYAVHLGETGRPPSPDVTKGDPADVIVGLEATQFRSMVFNNRMPAPWTAADDAAAERILASPASRRGGAEGASNYPPLYYAAAAAAAKVDDGGNVLDRMTLMRLASALFAAVAAFFAALFARELLPSAPWAWAAGGMVAAFQPMLGFMGGSVNNDGLLFAASAMLLYAVARALRGGLNVRLAAVAGAAIAIGMLTKPTMVALLPLACVGLGLAAWRGRRSGLPWRPVATFLVVAAVPVLAYSVVNSQVWDRGAIAVSSGALGSGSSGSGGGDAGAPAGAAPAESDPATAQPATQPWAVDELLSYTWQFYLPRLSSMTDHWGTVWPVRKIWFKGWIGRFGWQDTEFSWNFYLGAVIVWAAALGLFAAALWRRRAALRARWPEVVTYVLGAAAVIGTLHYIGYDYLRTTGEAFEQARYLLVLLPLYAGFAGLAAFGAGRRAGPVVAGALVVLAFGNMLAGLLITAARYYG